MVVALGHAACPRRPCPSGCGLCGGSAGAGGGRCGCSAGACGAGGRRARACRRVRGGCPAGS
eukprot:814963-Alexandrium_andersonii.AAC.1